MKKSIFTLFAVCFLILSAFTAFATDPVDSTNDFFNQNRSECVYLGRSFRLSNADGSVSVKSAPGSNQEIAVIENGKTVFIEYSCLFKGDYWGLTSFYKNNSSNQGKTYGWVKLDQFLVLYDYVAFEEEHLNEFYTYHGNYDKIKNTREVLAWQWPGSGSPLWTIKDIDTTNFRVLHAYKDEKGREWGFVTHFYDSPNIWICLSDPLNRAIPAFNPAPAPKPWVSETTHTDIGKSASPTIVLIIILVTALVVGTIILIKVFWKSDKIEIRREPS